MLLGMNCVLIPLFPGCSVPCIPLPPLCHLFMGIYSTPNLNYQGLSSSTHWSPFTVLGRAAYISHNPVLCVLPPGFFRPVPHQLPSSLISSLGSTQLYLIDRQRDMTHSSLQTLPRLADDLLTIILNASWHSKKERKFWEGLRENVILCGNDKGKRIWFTAKTSCKMDFKTVSRK